MGPRLGRIEHPRREPPPSGPLLLASRADATLFEPGHGQEARPQVPEEDPDSAGTVVSPRAGAAGAKAAFSRGLQLHGAGRAACVSSPHRSHRSSPPAGAAL